MIYDCSSSQKTGRNKVKVAYIWPAITLTVDPIKEPTDAVGSNLELRRRNRPAKTHFQRRLARVFLGTVAPFPRLQVPPTVFFREDYLQAVPRLQLLGWYNLNRNPGAMFLSSFPLPLSRSRYRKRPLPEQPFESSLVALRFAI
jgi:hypothetical protein